MKIDDLLTVAGGSALRLYVWGEGVVELINTMLPEDRKITPQITGDEAHVMIRTLPASALLGLLVLDLNVQNGKPIVPDVCVIEDEAVGPSGRRWFGRIQLPMVLGACIVLIAIVLAYAIQTTTASSEKRQSIFHDFISWLESSDDKSE